MARGRGVAALVEYQKARLQEAERNAANAAPPKEDTIRSTKEAGQHGSFRRDGAAQRRQSVIDTLRDQARISVEVWEKLTYFREQSMIASIGLYRCPLDRSPRGNSDGRSVKHQSALIEVGRMERDLGALLDIAKAVAVDDTTLANWCIEQHGGRERYDKKGRFVAMVPRSEKRVMRLALIDLKTAAGRIVVLNDFR